MTILAEVKKLGQQIWLDNLSRSLIQNGTLAHQLAQGVCGVTSNPAIFQKAFANDDLYQNEIHTLKKQGLDAKSIYEHLAIADVQAACDVCRDEFEQSGGTSGWVSLEVSPDLAHRAEDTITEAKRLHTAIQRPNVMIKVPATDAGLTALTDLVSEGISVNLTLLFSRTQTQKAYAAYQEGLTKRLTAGKDISTIQVVASFFISRIDAALDTTLPDHLQGKIAIALAKAAYQDWQNTFTNDAFKTLVQQHHANPVRLLWASTGVKNPNYSPTLYVDSLIGEHTINTVPEATLNAFCQSGRAATTLNQDSEQALTQLHEVAQLGIDLETLAHRLQEDGLKQFEQAFDALLKPLAN